MNPSTHTSILALQVFNPSAWLSIQPFAWRLLGLLIATGMGITSPVVAQPYPQSAVEGVQSDMQDGSVADIQRQLVNLGYYDGPVTGYFDTSTQAAVSRFQQDNGLTPDGIVGPATSSALSNRSAPSSPAAGAPAGGYMQMNDDGNQVSQLQQQLAQFGYYTGAMTGVFDAQTQAAVMNFQRDRGLAVDGIVGSATEAALYQSSQATAAAASSGTTTYTPSATPSDGLLQLGDVGTEVSDLQTKLQALGYYDGPISGSFGSQTQMALIAFQQAQGLTADGIAGPRVNTALGTVSPTQSPAQVAAAGSQPALTTTPVQPSVQPTIQPSVQPTEPSPAAGTPQITVSPQITPQITPPITGTQEPATVQVPPVTSSMPPVSTQSQPFPPSSGPSANRQPNSEGGRFSVAELQRRLQLRGFDPVDMTGVYDPATQNAITQAQQAYGLSESDLFGE